MKRMKQLKLIPQSWQMSDFPTGSGTSPSSRTSPGKREPYTSHSPSRRDHGGGVEKRSRLLLLDEEQVAAQQMTKLRDYFSNVTSSSPVRCIQTGTVSVLNEAHPSILWCFPYTAPKHQVLSEILSEMQASSDTAQDEDSPDYGVL